MKGKSILFCNTKKYFVLHLQLFALKRVSDIGIKKQESLSNQKLINLVGELYREGATFGDGSAMAAASEQIRSGILIGGKDHVLKIKERIKNLYNIIKTQNLSYNDKKYAYKLLDDMNKSLKGDY